MTEVIRKQAFGSYQVSVIGLGTSEFGGKCPEGAAWEFMDKYMELGGNFIDTARVYGDFVTPRNGESEKVIGRWLSSRHCRDKVFLSTKGGHPPMNNMSESRLSWAQIRADLADSLSDLQTDHVEIFWLHRDDPSRPVGEILETLQSLIEEGRTRMTGVSNWSPERIMEANAFADTHGYTPIIANQPQFSLARQKMSLDPTLVTMDEKTWRMHMKTGMVCCCFSSQAHGFFSKLDAGGLNAVSDKVKADAAAVYGLIAAAESQVHGMNVEEIHFHEVGTMDAVADVVGVCLLMEEIGADRVVASPVHVGSGFVRCMHGVLPVPTPATALLLQGIPSYGGDIRGELCTPTGAALLKHFAGSFGPQPVMATEHIGYGMGKKDFERANCVRAFLGTERDQDFKVTRLECNLDDMTGEDIGFAMERLFEAGAHDVFTQAVGMKKNRPGILLTCLCRQEDADRMAAEMMKHTTTLGIRRTDMNRYVLSREVAEKETEWGTVRVKRAEGMGVKKEKIEYEDLARIAREKNCSLNQLRKNMK